MRGMFTCANVLHVCVCVCLCACLCVYVWIGAAAVAAPVSILGGLVFLLVIGSYSLELLMTDKHTHMRMYIMHTQPCATLLGRAEFMPCGMYSIFVCVCATG